MLNLKMMVFFFAFIVIGVPGVIMIQSVFGKPSNSYDESGNQGFEFGCLGNLLGVVMVMVVFAIAAAISKAF